MTGGMRRRPVLGGVLRVRGSPACLPALQAVGLPGRAGRAAPPRDSARHALRGLCAVAHCSRCQGALTVPHQSTV